MKITMTPPSRFGWDGAPVDYVVRADGATTLEVTGKGLADIDAKVVDVRRTSTGVEGRIHVVASKGTFA